MDGAAVDLLGLVRQGQRQPPVDQAAEQQVEVGAVILDVGFQTSEHPLIVVIRRIVDVLHVGIVQLEDTETDIEVLRGHGAFGLDLIPGAADALLADFADVMWNADGVQQIHCILGNLLGFFRGFFLRINRFGKLDKNELTMLILLSVR